MDRDLALMVGAFVMLILTFLGVGAWGAHQEAEAEKVGRSECLSRNMQWVSGSCVR